jgi:hypothetical protein
MSALKGKPDFGRSQILSQPLIERVPHLALGGLCPVLDLCQQRWLNPYATMSDALAVGLRFSDRWLIAATAATLRTTMAARFDVHPAEWRVESAAEKTKHDI